MNHFIRSYNEAMAQNGGKITEAAGYLARLMGWHEETRGDAATLLIAFMLEPFRSIHSGHWEKLHDGLSLEAWVVECRPPPNDCEENWEYPGEPVEPPRMTAPVAMVPSRLQPAPERLL